MSENSTLELIRALGRVEGMQNQILSSVNSLQTKFGDHINEDQKAFSSMRTTITDQRAILESQFEKQSNERNYRLDAQDKKLDEIYSYIQWAKGFAYPLAGLIGLIGLVLVGILISLITNWAHLGKS
jgi:hypothetical protein